jgi:NAD-reducing hydrogenase small subunit
VTAPDPVRPPRLTLGTLPLAGCFGCHMSFLDIDERIFALLERVTLGPSPLTDVRNVEVCDIGLVEGGVCNEDNVHALRDFRARCRTLVAVGACAINGGLPALRNHLPVGDVLAYVYRDAPGLRPGAAVPDDPELPRLLDRIHPVHEVVRVDHLLPGCPPPADAFRELLTALLDGRPPRLGHGLIVYD